DISLAAAAPLSIPHPHRAGIMATRGLLRGIDIADDQRLPHLLGNTVLPHDPCLVLELDPPALRIDTRISPTGMAVAPIPVVGVATLGLGPMLGLGIAQIGDYPRTRLARPRLTGGSSHQHEHGRPCGGKPVHSGSVSSSGT